MLPTDNGQSMPCTPVSSNCVIWQGPDISCISLCSGDTVSDVVAKLATELCALIDATCECNPDLTGLNLNCITGVSDPTDLVEVLNAIITQACVATTGTTNNLNVSSKRLAADGNILLPKCLIYSDEFGNPITELPINEFVVYLANEICGITNSINLINSAIENFENRIGILENCVLPCSPKKDVVTDVVSTCLFPGQLKEVSILLLAIERDYCSLKGNVGTSQDILNSIAAQSLFGVTEKLSGIGTYSSNTNWINSPTNLSQSVKDQWVILADVYSAVKDIKDNLIDTGCSGLTFGFLYNVVTDSSNVPITLNLNFTSSSLPNSYSDCGGSTNVKITDSLGNEINQSVNVSSLQNSSTGANISLAALNVNNSITVQVDFCGTDGTNTCQEKQTIIIPLETVCPNDIVISAITEDSATVSFTNVLGTGVTYKIDIVDDLTSAIAATTTLSSPSYSISENFIGLSSGTNYSAKITITSSGVPKVCTPVTFATTGTICGNQSTNTTGGTGLNDIYLGFTDAGGVQTSYHYNPDDKVIVVGTPATPTCYAPIVNTQSINELTGIVTFNLSYGLTPGTSILIESGTDGTTWGLLDTGIDGSRVYASGVTSGSLYIRIQTDCTTSKSEYVILRYDFITDQWQFIQSPSACKSESIASACPAGVEVARQYLGCSSTTYSVFSGGVDSYWYYIRKYVRSGVTFYVYAGWNQSGGVKTVVECCTCPAFVLTDLMKTYCQEGGTVNIIIPYVLGSGTPTITTKQSTINGTLTQSATGSNLYSYTHIASSNSYADTFQIEVAPQVLGDCESTVATIQIQIIPCEISFKYKDQPIFVFIDTNVYTDAQGAQIKTGMLATIAAWNTAWGYTGTLYFIPTTSSRWLGYQKAIVDDGASANLSVDAAWVALQVLPTSWSAGARIYKNKAFLLALSNSSTTVYHDATLASGFGSGLTVQPKADYKDDFNAYNDALNGTTNTTWATALGLFNNQYPDGFSGVYYPFVTKLSTAADAAAVLMSLAAYVGEMIPPSEYGIKTMVDVTGYLMQGLVPSATNPYQGASPSVGPPLEPLYTKGWLVYLNNELKSTTYAEIAAGTNEQWSGQLDLAAKLCDSTYPLTSIGSTLMYQVSRCDTGATELIHITTPGLYPAYGTFYKSLAAHNSLSTDVCFRFTGYGVGAASWEFGTSLSTQTGCEGCGTIFLVQDCSSTDQYKVNFGATTGIGIGFVYKVKNTGASFVPGDGRDNWDNNEEKCLTILSATAAAEITTATITGYSDCDTCVVTL